jgi:hypothetical protein
MKTIARQALIALPGGSILLAVLWLIARLLPPAGILLYFPTVVGLEMLEDQGYKTLKGSPDGWPVPTDLGLWISGVAWWLVCSLAVLLYLLFRDRRGKRYSGAV